MRSEIMWGRYIARRIGQGLVVLWAAYTISFLILYLLPGDAATLFAVRGPLETGKRDHVCELK
jgi:peptide/nickel transport system permease protein